MPVFCHLVVMPPRVLSLSISFLSSPIKKTREWKTEREPERVRERVEGKRYKGKESGGKLYDVNDDVIVPAITDERTHTRTYTQTKDRTNIHHPYNTLFNINCISYGLYINFTE